MPIYEYGCTSCGNRIEVVHGLHSSGPERCELCGAPMRKLLSTPAIVFKGSGWAKKDARDAARAGRPTGSDGGAPDRDAATGDAAGGTHDGQAAATPSAASADAGRSERSGAGVTKDATGSKTGSASSGGANARGSAATRGAGDPAPGNAPD